MNKLRVVHIVASLAEASGGPPRSVVNLCQQLHAAGISVSILTLDTGPHFGKSVPVDESIIKVTRVPCRYFRPLRLIVSPAFRSVATRAVADADVIHSHGMWLGVNRHAAALARQWNRGHVLSPRGNLHPACLCQSAWKKTLARRWFVDRSLAEAQCIHVTSHDELAHVRALGFKTPVARVPVAVQRPALNSAELRTVCGSKWPHLAGRRVLLFLARVHPHKGIFELAQAWAQLHQQHPDWHLVIAGPDEVGCLNEVKAQLATASDPARTTLTGAVSGTDKWALLANSELVVLPTHSENFGHVIAEALSLGKPVLTTTAAPWQSMREYGCGWQVEVGFAPVKRGLAEVLPMAPERLAEMGRNGIRLVEAEHDPKVVIAKMSELYEWGANRKGRPDWVKI